MSAGSTHPSGPQGILGTLNSLPHPSSSLKTLLSSLSANRNRMESSSLRHIYPPSDNCELQRCTSLPISSVPLSISIIPFNLIILEGTPLTQMVCDDLWHWVCHRSSRTSYEHVCEMGNPHSKARAFEAQKVFKGLDQETTWWHKEQRRDILPLRPPLEDKLFPLLSSLTHKQQLWTLPRSPPPRISCFRLFFPSHPRSYFFFYVSKLKFIIVYYSRLHC